MSMNRMIADPGLKDLLDQHKKDINLTLNCHAIGIIQTFNAQEQTATIKIAYNKTFYAQNETGGDLVPFQKSYEPLVQVPIIFLGGGTIYQTFPVKAGDECLVMFNDRDINIWFQGTNGTSPQSSRLHSLADGIAIVGLRSLAHSIESFDGTRWIVKDTNGGATLGVGGGKVLIANELATLNGLVGQLMDIITNLDIVGVGSGTVNPAQQTQLQTLKTQIGQLLE